MPSVASWRGHKVPLHRPPVCPWPPHNQRPRARRCIPGQQAEHLLDARSLVPVLVHAPLHQVRDLGRALLWAPAWHGMTPSTRSCAWRSAAQGWTSPLRTASTMNKVRLAQLMIECRCSLACPHAHCNPHAACTAAVHHLHERIASCAWAQSDRSSSENDLRGGGTSVNASPEVRDVT